MDKEPVDRTSEDDGDREPATWRAPFSTAFWLQAVLGLGLAGYGLYMLSERGWRSPTGFLLLCVGVLFLPLWFARILGGAGLVGLSIWLATHTSVMFEYLLSAVYFFVGGSAVMDGVREFRSKRGR